MTATATNSIRHVGVFRSGKILLFRDRKTASDRGAIIIATGKRSDLKRRVTCRARHAYKRGTYLVPGIPEATSDDEALQALVRFQQFLLS